MTEITYGKDTSVKLILAICCHPHKSVADTEWPEEEEDGNVNLTFEYISNLLLKTFF
jgi:hypothetical protein